MCPAQARCLPPAPTDRPCLLLPAVQMGEPVPRPVTVLAASVADLLAIKQLREAGKSMSAKNSPRGGGGGERGGVWHRPVRQQHGWPSWAGWQGGSGRGRVV